MQERGLQGEEEGVEKKLEVRERGSRKRVVHRLTTAGEKKKGNNRQEGRGGSG